MKSDILVTVREGFLGKFETLGEICRDIAQVFFATLAIESFQTDHVNWVIVLSGIVLASIFWIISLRLSIN